jgi:GTP-binding protein EngB required for normal cell division
MLTRIKQQLFLFIDTPGFGHPELSNNKVEEAIYKMLGYFTRVLGHIHGVLYFQSILEDRVSPGMKDSAEFLRKLIPANKLDRLTFITTKWDTVAPKVKRIRINKASGARSFQLDVDCDFGTMDEKTDARKRVVNEVLNQYQVASHMGLFMPFNQWTNGEKTFYVVTAPVRGLIWVIENTSFSVGVGVDADIRF